jgi:hypothetical protein
MWRGRGQICLMTLLQLLKLCSVERQGDLLERTRLTEGSIVTDFQIKAVCMEAQRKTMKNLSKDMVSGTRFVLNRKRSIAQK